MIEFGPKIKCDNCTKPKGGNNYWFRVVPGRRAVVIWSLGPENIQSREVVVGEQHACGEECLAKLVLLMVRERLTAEE